MKEFPKGFLWGTATAAHQVEGNNVASDIWAMEHSPHSIFQEPSGDALDMYHRYGDDIASVSDLGLNAFRFGVEWARIEPEKGLISQAELDHYSRMVDSCLEHGIAPVITLQHFTSPHWTLTRGGWENPDLAKWFAEHSARVAERLGDRVEWFVTINEANTPQQILGNGLFPPEQEKMVGAARVGYAKDFGVEPEKFVPFFPFANSEDAIAVIIDAHRQAVDSVHSVRPDAKVGISLSMQEHVGESGGEEQAAQMDQKLNRRWLDDAGSIGDFVAVQNYTRNRYDENGHIFDTENVTGNGLAIVPESLSAVVREAHEITGKPILITEHGADLNTERDPERIKFIRDSLEVLADTIADGVDVRGYIHWCLADNWEWVNGYKGQFGLFEVDRSTQVRTARPSAGEYGKIARANAI